MPCASVIKFLRFCLPALALLAVATLPLSAAQTKLESHEVTVVTLDDATIDRLLASFAELSTVDAKYGGDNNALSTDPGSLTAMGDLLRGHTAWNEIDTVLKSHGFVTMAHWVDAMATLAMTLGMAEDDMGPEAMEAQMQEALAQLDQMPMPDEQKQSMREALSGSFGMLSRVTPENYAAVHARRAEIRQKLDEIEGQ